MTTDRRAVLAGAGLGISVLALPRAAAAASGGGSSPAALIGAETVPMTNPGYVDLIAGMSGDSGTEDLTTVNRWHLGYAFVDIQIDGFRLFGVDAAAGTNTSIVSVAVAAAPDTFGGFPAATQHFVAPTPDYAPSVETTGSFPAVTVPAGHHVLIAMAGANGGRAYVTSRPSRIATSGGQPIVGFETGYWQSEPFVSDATTLNGFTRANRFEDGAMDRIGWRVTIAN